jgi:hypothetical protein
LTVGLFLMLWPLLFLIGYYKELDNVEMLKLKMSEICFPNILEEIECQTYDNKKIIAMEAACLSNRPSVTYSGLYNCRKVKIDYYEHKDLLEGFIIFTGLFGGLFSMIVGVALIPTIRESASRIKHFVKIKWNDLTEDRPVLEERTVQEQI